MLYLINALVTIIRQKNEIKNQFFGNPSIIKNPLSYYLLISFLNLLILTRFNGISCPNTLVWCSFASSNNFLSNALSSLLFILLIYWSLVFGCFLLICPPKLCALLNTSLQILHFITFPSSEEADKSSEDVLKWSYGFFVAGIKWYWCLLTAFFLLFYCTDRNLVKLESWSLNLSFFASLYCVHILYLVVRTSFMIFDFKF